MTSRNARIKRSFQIESLEGRNAPSGGLAPAAVSHTHHTHTTPIHVVHPKPVHHTPVHHTHK